MSERSPAERLAAAPKEVKAAFLASLKPQQAEELLYSWRGFHARPSQIAPPGDWTTWVALAGRGFGKTRLGSEWVREEVAAGRATRIALIAETAADARDVMVEGPSGILAVHPPKDRPIYEPSKRRLTWPNGAIATLFNATEPDQLRGPQFDLGWCFIAGTMVLTPDGEKPIETIRSGDMVMTRGGPRRVLAAASREEEVGTVAFSTGRALTGTAEHPVLTSHGWTIMSDLQNGDAVCVGSASNGAAFAGIDTAEDTTNIAAQSRSEEKTGTGCTAPFTRRTTEKYRMATMFITSMATKAITRLKTWLSLPEASISGATCSATRMVACAQTPRLSRRYVATAGRWSSAAYKEQRAAFSVSENPLTKSKKHSVNAGNAGQSSKAKAENFAASVVSTWARAGRQNVYNIRVEGLPEYYANGVLVHNCDELAKWRYARETWDMLQFGLRIGDRPRQLVTTTPRPIELVKELVARAAHGDGVVITRGSTLDNRSNLAVSFIREVEARYAGTRLGRQEIEGEVLGDMPGALWTRDVLDRHRVRTPPRLERIVVAVDPAVTAGEDADETGIVIVGMGTDGRCYVLADNSLRATPQQWARAAVNAYRQYEADAIVAEVNNGGDMVAMTMRSVDPNVHVQEVRATRGKHIRAEPISAFYEQGRVSHVGGFPALEDQMCLMTQAGYVGENSPDRLDALVWAMTAFIKPMAWKAAADEDDFRRDDYPMPTSSTGY